MKLLIAMILLFSSALAAETIDSKALKALIDGHTPVVLLDARGDDWNVGTTIEGAKLARYDSPTELFSQLIPRKDALVVVFCYSATCPLGPKLRDKLSSLGYSHVVEYKGGITEWRDAKYPTDALFRLHMEDSSE